MKILIMFGSITFFLYLICVSFSVMSEITDNPMLENIDIGLLFITVIGLGITGFTRLIVLFNEVFLKK